jgi:aminoglycoside 3-N-acetyltransferase
MSGMGLTENIAGAIRGLLPEGVLSYLSQRRRRRRHKRLQRLTPLSEHAFSAVLRDQLGLVPGDIVYIGSSVSDLSLDFPATRVLPLIRDAIGPRGTMLFPNYPNQSPISSYEWLIRGNVFDIRSTRSFTGALTEMARCHPDAVRSLHPTKSVCAIGPAARDLTDGHHLLEYPYDLGSPYRRVIEAGGKIVGIGIWTEYLSYVYTVDDALKENPPVETYYPDPVEGKCIDYDGREVRVFTRAHNMTNVVHDIPPFFKEFVPAEVCEDLIVHGMRFFRADASKLFDHLLMLAGKGYTVYPRSLYTERFLKTLKDQAV